MVIALSTGCSPSAPPANSSSRASANFQPNAPDFEPGMEVVGPANGRIGVLQTLANSADGYTAVLLIDGKLVSVPVGTLRRSDGRILSSQTKAQILDKSGAPR